MLRHPSTVIVQPRPDEVTVLLDAVKHHASGWALEAWLQDGGRPYGCEHGGSTGPRRHHVEYDSSGIGLWRDSDRDDSPEHLAYRAWLDRQDDPYLKVLPTQTWARLTWAQARKLLLAQISPQLTLGLEIA